MQAEHKFRNGKYIVYESDDDIELQNITLTREELSDIAGAEFVYSLEQQAWEHWLSTAQDRQNYFAELYD